MLHSFRPLREHSGLACPDGFPAWPESAKALRARRTGKLRCIFEKIGQLRGERPFFTPYSIAVLRSNGHFSNAKAVGALGFYARPLRETLQSMILWFQGQNLIPPAR